MTYAYSCSYKLHIKCTCVECTSANLLINSCRNILFWSAFVQSTQTRIEYTRITTQVVNLPFCALSSQLNYYLISVARPSQHQPMHTYSLASCMRNCCLHHRKYNTGQLITYNILSTWVCLLIILKLLLDYNIKQLMQAIYMHNVAIIQVSTAYTHYFPDKRTGQLSTKKPCYQSSDLNLRQRSEK